ncbi:hypothetical protein D7Y13_13850 [Corallococcus praedator]|uniref:DUF3592 domain-containing protein n=1 Tax=Corallococcus praedator TaxID=2316724 RepID=A0ABX9QJ04_9BACT|nr:MULTISPECIES: DUF3592 domain-containing protein [Corallococcus]RKH07165.1 hypothetical protein D7X74_33175 [Corallococcus sp. CA047B]RKH27446.1 hypothetical protein D7X75_26395 [Corallococcus sp. CA031C]RKI09780.1 hypothetical protein D7Y13_13850 [Corallococcus praedator]
MNVQFVLFELFTLVVTPLLLLWARHTYQHHSRLRRKGMHARATITEKVIHHGGGSRNSSTCTLHYVFSLPDGTELHHSYEDHATTWFGLSKGSEVDVAYWPNDLSWSLPEGGGVSGPLFSAYSALAVIVFCAGLYVLVDRVWEPEPGPSEPPPAESQMRPLRRGP